MQLIECLQKVSPPADFTILKGALDSNGPVLKRSYNNEEISISVMRLANIVEDEDGNDDDEGEINQLFVHVDVSKPGMSNSLHFLCGLYPDALGIHSVALRPKSSEEGFLMVPNNYTGPLFEFVPCLSLSIFVGFVSLFANLSKCILSCWLLDSVGYLIVFVEEER